MPPGLRDAGKLVGSPISLRQLGQQCHLPSPLSMRRVIDAPGCPLTHRLRLHLKVLTAPSLAIETMLLRMREIYGAVGIRVAVASRETLDAAALGAPVFNALNDMDVAECDGAGVSAEQMQLFGFDGGVAPGHRVDEAVVFFVRSATKTSGGTLNGCATFPAGRPGVVIAQVASQWTLAHELGHMLGLLHIAGENTNCPASSPLCCSTPDRTRLMTGCSTSNIIGTPTLDATERATMLANPLARLG